jgi:hypothetical protein
MLNMSTIPSGLPTPETTPLQKDIEYESQDQITQESPSSDHDDPTVIPAIATTKEDDAPLFPSSQSVAVTRVYQADEHAWYEVAGDQWSRQAENNRQVRSANVNVSNGHGSGSIVFGSHMWTSASQSPDAYLQMLIDSNAAQTLYTPGENSKMDALLRAVEVSRRLPPTTRAAPIATTTSSARRRSSAIESRRPSNGRTSSTKKRSNTEESAPEAKRMRAAAVKKEKPQRYTQVVDYCPPLLTTLERQPPIKPFMQKGNRISHRNDPDLHLIGVELCSTEAQFAEVNQLDINKYLINKRKIFEGRVRHHLQGGRGFTKTHAQGAAIIDVNKASRLWEFYDQAGWFNIELFTKHFPTELAAMRKAKLPIAPDFQQ